MALWARVSRDGRDYFGTIERDKLLVHSGDMFGTTKPTGESIPLVDAKRLAPVVPGKMVALVDNYHALVAKLGHAVPSEPLYFLKAASSFLADGETIRTPRSYGGKVIYEGELGVVIGRRLSGAGEPEAAAAIFGYTCINDVVATGIDPSTLVVRTILNDQERQNYPVTDIIFPPARLASLISHDMTLEPGDIIACGTSVGVGSMKPGSTVSILIEGIGTLTNRFE